MLNALCDPSSAALYASVVTPGGMGGGMGESCSAANSSPSVWKMTMGRVSSASNSSRSVAISALYCRLRPKRWREPPSFEVALCFSHSSFSLSSLLSREDREQLHVVGDN